MVIQYYKATYLQHNNNADCFGIGLYSTEPEKGTWGKKKNLNIIHAHKKRLFLLFYFILLLLFFFSHAQIMRNNPWYPSAWHIV